jgi:hypothetical protein
MVRQEDMIITPQLHKELGRLQEMMYYHGPDHFTRLLLEAVEQSGRMDHEDSVSRQVFLNYREFGNLLKLFRQLKGFKNEEIHYRRA